MNGASGEQRHDPCPGIGWRGEEPYECGLWCGHDGEHIWFTPGIYLERRPLLHPLAVTYPRCPTCARPVWWKQPLVLEQWWVTRDGVMTACYDGPVAGAVLERVVSFAPCGCEMREIVAG